MRDGAAEGALTRGTLRVDVDPLVIAGAVCELIDARLVQGDPRGHADFLADVLRKIRERNDLIHLERSSENGCACAATSDVMQRRLSSRCRILPRRVLIVDADWAGLQVCHAAGLLQANVVLPACDRRDLYTVKSTSYEV